MWWGEGFRQLGWNGQQPLPTKWAPRRKTENEKGKLIFKKEEKESLNSITRKNAEDTFIPENNT